MPGSMAVPAKSWKMAMGARTATVAESTHAAQERALTARKGFDEIVYFIESCLGERVLESS